MSLLDLDGSPRPVAATDDSPEVLALRAYLAKTKDGYPLSRYDESQRVVITDIDMTIGTMCRFMVKWAIAAIPASIILAVIWLIVAAVCLGLYRLIN